MIRGDKYDELDTMVLMGDLKPVVRWKFKNAQILILIQVHGPNTDGERFLQPAMLIVGPNVEEYMNNPLYKKRGDDF
jgi:hypothetical protein